MPNDKNITCPRCGADFPISEAVEHMMADVLGEHQASLEADARKREAAARMNMEQELQRKYNDEVETIRQTSLDQAAAAQARILELEQFGRDAKAEADRIRMEAQQAIYQKTRELENEKARMTAELERNRLDLEKATRDRQAQLEKELRDKIATEVALKQGEQASLNESLTKKVLDLERQLQQASQQLQGEAQEYALEEVLRMAFPTDIIEAVPKGCKGADCIQKVRTNGTILGTIIWESKRTKAWANDWIGKLRDDQRTLAAEVAILVTQAFPADLKNKSGVIDGVILTDFPTAMLAGMLSRIQIIEVARMKMLSNSSDEKTQVLFSYISSEEFRQRLKAVAKYFIDADAQIESERRAFEKQFKQRKLNNTRAMTSVVEMHAALQNILGSGAIPNIEETTVEQLPATEQKQLTE